MARGGGSGLPRPGTVEASGREDPVATERLDEVADWVAAADRVVALTGAGISTDSGIPDFRGPQGIWTRDPEAQRLATLDAWLEDADLRREAWQFRLGLRDVEFAPNAGHRAVADLGRHDRMDLLVTQNIDGLHQQAGTPASRVVEVHGTAREAVCLQCDRRWPMEEILDRVAAGDPDPRCEACGGLVKAATISFGQSLVEQDLVRAQAAAESCDVFLALGTSLAVYPVAWLPLMARRQGARVVIVNAEPTEQDDIADAVLVGRLGTLLPALVDRIRSRLPQGSI